MSEQRIVTIHQPDFMPWLGFFLKAYRANVFVVLDHVVNNVKDGSWFRRVRLLVSGRPSWISIPLIRPESGPFQQLKEMKICNDAGARRLFNKYLRSFEQSYSRAPFYKEYKGLFFDYFKFLEENNSLVHNNMRFIKEVFALLGIDAKVVYSSQLGVYGKKTELLINIVKTVGGDVYLCGDGAADYQDNSMFESAGLTVLRNNFIPVCYKQVGAAEFVPGLSVLDALMNLGSDGVKQMLEVYCKP